ncbi:calcium uniporter protein, mitochondrial-like [Haliotis rufescens]|uniref:calcium uniporter protein, mitochondrial-like n=1 Tax=Haliotis rufescens TaxID=6454 RepID=UPI001EB01B06|nr:calcium uniporter protein, mitochondrial-like [Haliotis rufescens]
MSIMATSPLTLLLRRNIGKHFVRKKVRPLLSNFRESSQIGDHSCPCYFYCTQVLFRNDVTVKYSDGLPVLSVPLPSRRETCEFTLKPITHTVGDFLRFLREEDGGIDRASVYTQDGSRVARSTTIDILLRSDFKLIINEEQFTVSPPETRPLVNEDAVMLSDVKALISTLFSTLNVEQYQLEREKELQQQLEDLKVQLAPLERVKQDLAMKSTNYTSKLTWLGLGLMGLQFGILARLTWWEYSWDIMEPVTYFVTYGTTMAMYAYFVVTKQDYSFPDIRDRQFLLKFYKQAKKQNLDVHKYNELRDAVSQVEHDLRRLRDPLQLHLPITELEKVKFKQETA